MKDFGEAPGQRCSSSRAICGLSSPPEGSMENMESPHQGPAAYQAQPIHCSGRASM